MRVSITVPETDTFPTGSYTNSISTLNDIESAPQKNTIFPLFIEGSRTLPTTDIRLDSISATALKTGPVLTKVRALLRQNEDYMSVTVTKIV